MYADLPFNLTIVGLFLVQFFSVLVFLFGIKAVAQGKGDVVSSTREQARNCPRPSLELIGLGGCLPGSRPCQLVKCWGWQPACPGLRRYTCELESRLMRWFLFG